jgi:hypothetical protein
MTTVGAIRREHAAIIKWQTAVAEAAIPFEARWTLAGLRRVDAALYERLQDQRALFDAALATGTAQDIELQGAALCRGYAVVIQALERAAEPDNAYMVGLDGRSGFRVAIGQQKATATRVRQIGEDAVWITPDEVALILANLESFKPLAAIRRMFPGGEILDVRPSDGGPRIVSEDND